jgi:hypothetical protein
VEEDRLCSLKLQVHLELVLSRGPRGISVVVRVGMHRGILLSISGTLAELFVSNVVPWVLHDWLPVLSHGRYVEW